MDITTIQSNETRNKGAYVFLYLSDTSGQWVAYGLSAYALRLHVKAQGLRNKHSNPFDLWLEGFYMC